MICLEYKLYCIIGINCFTNMLPEFGFDILLCVYLNEIEYKLNLMVLPDLPKILAFTV